MELSKTTRTRLHRMLAKALEADGSFCVWGYGEKLHVSSNANGRKVEVEVPVSEAHLAVYRMERTLAEGDDA